MSEAEHRKELEGLLVTRAANRAAMDANEADRAVVATKRSQARISVRAKFATLTIDEAAHLADCVKEAAAGSPNVYQRMIVELEGLGVSFPNGTRP